MVTITVEEVRERFPEFSDNTLYTDSTIDSTIVLAELWIDHSPSIKDNLARQLLFFLTAHFIVFAKKAQNGNFDSVRVLGEAGLETTVIYSILIDDFTLLSVSLKESLSLLSSN